MMEIEKVLSPECNEKNIVIVCAGVNGRITADILLKLRRRVCCFMDNDISKQNGEIRGLRVCAAEEAAKQYGDAVYIITNFNHSLELKQQLVDLGVLPENVVSLDGYSFDELKGKCPELWKTEDNYLIYDEPIKRGISYLLSWERFLWEQRKHLCKKKVGKFTGGYRVSVCAIFKNEACYLKEWLDYHMLVGVEHFYLYNNNSEDDFMKILRPYIAKGVVTYTDWPYRQGQMSAYTDCITRFRQESRWIGFIDLDEFVTPIKYDKIYDFLQGFEQYGSVWIPWKMFGSSGIVERDISRPVAADFVSCWSKPVSAGKCFYHTSYEFLEDMNKNGAFHHLLYTVDGKKVYPPVNVFGQFCAPPIYGGRKAECPIQINHYVIKSWKEYEKKIMGTDVYYKVNPHSKRAFQYNDKKAVSRDLNIQRFVKELQKGMDC